MRALLIAYSFPPSQDAQAIRWYYLTNALAALGIKIDVLTIKGFSEGSPWSFHHTIRIFRSYPGFFEYLSLQTKKRIGVEGPENSEMRRTLGFRVLKYLYWKLRKGIGGLLPGDIRTEWLPFALRLIKRQIPIGEYDVIITSHEPWVDSLIGLYLKKKNKNIKWVADFGDPYVLTGTPRWKLWFENRLERSIYESADLLIFTNRAVIAYLEGKYPFLQQKRKLIAEQGFSLKVSGEKESEATVKNVFTMAYTGTFYRRSRDPSNLIKALSMLDFEYTFVLAGRNEEFLKAFDGLGKRFQYIGIVDHFDALKLQKKSDVLIHISNTNAHQFPGKFYEYLGSGKPVLSIVHREDDPVAGITETLNCGIVCTNDPQEIKTSIEALYKKWKNGEAAIGMSPDLYEYSWERKAEAISGALRELTGTAPFANSIST